MASVFHLLGCCCSRNRHQKSNGWEESMRLYSDEEDIGQDSTVIMPMYTLNHPQPQTAVRLDVASAGQYAVILKNSTRLCGSGAARASVPIVQDKAYFEVKIQTNGLWGIGLCHSKANMNIANDMQNQETAWVLFNDGKIYHNSEALMELETSIPEEGDILGIYYDHTDLRFTVNGVPVFFQDHGVRCYGATGIRGTVYPLLAVDQGAILDIRFTAFQYPPREGGYTEIRLEKNIL
nr:chronic lymphocytic leukemia deletion region [Hymenolepis microstoma]